MTHSQFLDWLWGIAGGWLGWKPNEFEFSSMDDILKAYEAHVEKLKTIYGSGEDKNKKQEIQTAEHFIAAFGNKGQ